MKNTSNIAFFQSVDPDVHEECIKYMTYIRLRPGQEVFRAGEVGTTFYVILKGSVGVLIYVPAFPPTPEIPNPERVWREVKVLRDGEAFGELALINNKPRAATISCKEECHFGVLDKVHYNMILSTCSS